VSVPVPRFLPTSSVKGSGRVRRSQEIDRIDRDMTDAALRTTIVCIPVGEDGFVDPRWGRAERVAVATLSGDHVDNWQEFEVGWGRLHDEGPEGVHHARIARFLQDHGVQVVVAAHMGPGMMQMLAKMPIAVRLGAAGRAREAVRECAPPVSRGDATRA
jgi:predicted Fe-Mo cluster-binding NifX family protein